MKKIDKKAFTLIELLVVIAVIGILVLLAAPRFTGYTQKAEDARIQHDIKVMEQEVGTVLINGEDDFNKWENNSKDYLNQLAQDNELFEKEGPVANDKPIDGSYKIIPEKYKSKINTKLKGTFYANSDGKVYYEHGKGPGYSDEEIEDLIAEGFIPIAWAEDLNSIRSTKKRIYAAGTKWETPVEVEGGLDKKYIQVQNVLDLTDLSGYSEEGWKPIGTSSSSRFRGTYDGGNYVITGLEVKGEDKDNQGLFGYTSGATIRNVGLIDNKVTGRNYVGGLVGYAGGSTKISNSYATGEVTGKDYVGGLVGDAAFDTTISNSYATGEVTGKDYVGGLAGSAWGETVSNSYATGPVKGVNRIGGLVGRVTSSTKISNSYATGNVTGVDYVGGLVGDAGSISITISNSYATGSVKGVNRIGGLVGRATSSTKISNSYATGRVTGVDYVGGLVGRAEAGTNISNSYATGSVTGESKVGGLVGITNNKITIENSYATGSVTGENEVGGLVGWTARGIIINNSYATGPVTGTIRVGGLVGGTSQRNTISNSYWDKVTTGQDTSAGEGEGESEGKSTDDMIKQTTYKDWNFDNVWKIDDGKYPTLR